MDFTLAELAAHVGGRVEGDSEVAIHGANILRDAGPQEITLAADAQHLALLASCPAVAAVVGEPGADLDRPAIVAQRPIEAFAKIVQRFRPQRQELPEGIHPSAVVSPSAQLGKGVQVGPLAVIGDDVIVGEQTTIHSGVRILNGCAIGDRVTLFPNVVLYENTRVGSRAIIHAGAVLGAYGFGYDSSSGQHELTSQLGWVEVQEDVEIGANSTIDRGTFGATSIGKGTKIDNLVMVAHNCHIGPHNLLCSQVGIAGSTSTGEYVVMGGQAGVRDHVSIGAGVQIAAKAGVKDSLPAGGRYVGIPAIKERRQLMVFASLQKIPEMRRSLRTLLARIDQLEREQLESRAVAAELAEAPNPEAA